MKQRYLCMSSRDIKKLLFDVEKACNRLIHGYASVSEQVVWGIVTNDVPILLAQVRSLL